MFEIVHFFMFRFEAHHVEIELSPLKFKVVYIVLGVFKLLVKELVLEFEALDLGLEEA